MTKFSIKIKTFLITGVMFSSIIIYFNFLILSHPSSIKSEQLMDVRTAGINSYILDFGITWDSGAHDCGESIIVDSSGNIYVTGYRKGGAFLAKYDNSGFKQWLITRDGFSANDIALDASSNVYVAGTTNIFGNLDAFIAKYDNFGVQLWNTTWGGSSSDEANSIELDSSGNIYIMGETKSFGAGQFDAFIAKFNSSGILLWNTTWGNEYIDRAWDGALDDLGNFYITGSTTYTYLGYNDVYIAKYNSMGILQWNKTWGLSNSEGGRGITVDDFGNIYITGNTASFSKGDLDELNAFVLRYNSSGILEWNITWGGLEYDNAYDIVTDKLGSIYITGYTYVFTSFSYLAFIAKFNSSGILQWSTNWPDHNYGNGEGIALDPSENIFITGNFNNNGENYDFFLVKYYLDNTPPRWEQDPTDIISEYNVPFRYDVNASDRSGIGLYWVNDTENFQVDSNGIITNKITLGIGDYWLEINVNDIFGNTNTTTFKISIQDTMAPEWDQPLINQTLELGFPFRYDVNASDPSGISTYWVNDTDNFQISSNGTITNVNALFQGKYWLEIKVNDTFGNVNYANINITIVGASPPIWDPLPGDHILEYGNSFFYDVNASDPSGISTYWVNDTDNFQVDGNGFITNTNALFVGEYWLEISVNDTLGYINTTTINILVQDTIAPEWNPKLENQTSIYGIPFRYTINASDLSGISTYWVNDTYNFQIESNGIIIDKNRLPIGEYWLKISVNDTYGNMNTATIKISILEAKSQDGGSLPGFDLLMFIGVILVISTFIIRKNRRLKK